MRRLPMGRRFRLTPALKRVQRPSVTPGHTYLKCVPVSSAGTGFLPAYTRAPRNPVASREVELGRDGLAFERLAHRRIATWTSTLPGKCLTRSVSGSRTNLSYGLA